MRYFVQPFENFGVDMKYQLEPEVYMELLAKVSDVKEFLGSDLYGKPMTKERYKEICSSYRGSYGTDYGMCVKPGGELEIEYSIFEIKNFTDPHKRWDGRCRLRIWLTKQDVYKLYGL